MGTVYWAGILYLGNKTEIKEKKSQVFVTIIFLNTNEDFSCSPPLHGVSASKKVPLSKLLRFFNKYWYLTLLNFSKKKTVP